MARARNIKPGFFKNEFLADLPFETRLLFIGLWTLADREGRLEDRPRKIKMELFAYDSLDVDSMLGELERNEFIVRYEVDGSKFVQIINFVKHQDPHYREKASEIPAPDGHSNKVIATNITRSQRARILERDEYKCQHCGATENLCIDHILPVSRGGNSDDENLQVLCLSCNTKKGNKLSTEINSNSIQSRVDVELNSERNVPLIPDSPFSDSLNPDSHPPHPDSHKDRLDEDDVREAHAALALVMYNGDTLRSAFELQEVNRWLSEFPKEIVLEAIRKVGLSGGEVKRPMSVIEKQLWEWHGKGLLTVDAIRQAYVQSGARAAPHVRRESQRERVTRMMQEREGRRQSSG